MQLKKTSQGKQLYAMNGRGMYATKEVWKKILKKMGEDFDEADLIPVYEN